MSDKPVIFTVGHSTRGPDELVQIVRAHGVRAIADVRRFPRSRRYPHFNDDALARELPRAGIEYLAFASLGGLRKPRTDSVNTSWRNTSFRGYADFMQTEPFMGALEGLISIARDRPTAIMCAEAVPWRCHRSLIADALVVRGWEVHDIMDAEVAPKHQLPQFAIVAADGITIEYRGDPGAHAKEPNLFEQ